MIHRPAIAHVATALCGVIATQIWALSAMASSGASPPQPTAVQPAPAAPAATAKPWGKLTAPTGQTWKFTKPEITVGSAAECDVVLTDQTIAPQHFRIAFAEGSAAVEDLGSKGGTLVVGKAVKPGKPFKVWNNLDIYAGAVRLQFEFLERGRIAPTQPPKNKSQAPKNAGKSVKGKGH